MANVIGSMVIEMAVNLARLRSDFGQAAQISNTRLREIERSARNTVREISSVGRTIQNAFSTIGVSVGLTSLIYGLKAAATEAIAYGDTMEKASLKTGLAASEFATLAEAAKLADVEVGTLSKGMRALQVNISKAASDAGGGPAKLFRALGIEIEKFKQLKADQQLELLADQLTRLKDPADQARVGVELFGRAWDEIAPFLLQGSAGMREATAEIERLGGALGPEQLRALADADSAIKQLSFSWKGLSRALTAEFVPAITTSIDLLRALVETDWSRALPFMPWAGQGMVDAYKQFTELAQEADRRRSESVQPRGPRFRRVFPEGLPTPTVPTEDRGGGRAQAEQGLQEIAIYTERMYNFQNELEDAISELNDETMSEVRNMMGAVGESTSAMMEEIAASVRGAQEAVSALTPYAEQAARNIQDAFAQWLFDPFEEGVRGMLSGFVDAIRQMIAQYVAMQAITGLGKALAGTDSAVLQGIGGFLQGKATGGPVAAGMPYLVGERGPELFVPKSAGTVMPNGAMGGVTVNYQIDARGADAERIMAILPGMLRQTEQRTIATLMHMQRQGRFS